MKIISKRQRIESVSYQQGWNWNSGGGGFSFPCNEKGEIDLSTMGEAGKRNLANCIFGVIDVHYTGIETYHHSYSEPAIGKCRCGCEVVLASFTNSCFRCDRDYNMSGQELAHRSQWGEETGESLLDILSIQ